MLSIDNEPWTEADASQWESLLTASDLVSDGSRSFFLCAVQEVVGGTLLLSSLDSSRRLLSELDCTAEAPNLAISFASAETLGAHLLSDASGASFVEHASAPDVILMVAPSPRPPPCTARFVRGGDSGEGTYYRLDERLKMIDNTLSKPAVDATEYQTYNYGCPNVPKTFLNVATCAQTESCAPLAYSSATFELNETTLREWYQRSNRYIYYVDGLRLEEDYAISPCDVSHTSRWTQVAGTCQVETSLDVETAATLTKAIRVSADQSNLYVRDISVSEADGTCYTEFDGVSTIGASITVDAFCWTHVHPSHYDVRDFTYWVNQHPGNEVALKASRRNPISAFAEKGGVKLTFPLHHLMSAQWKPNVKYNTLIGRLGDVWPALNKTPRLGESHLLASIPYVCGLPLPTSVRAALTCVAAVHACRGVAAQVVDFATLTSSVQSVEMAEYVGAYGSSLASGGAEACGS